MPDLHEVFPRHQVRRDARVRPRPRIIVFPIKLVGELGPNNFITTSVVPRVSTTKRPPAFLLSRLPDSGKLGGG